MRARRVHRMQTAGEIYQTYQATSGQKGEGRMDMDGGPWATGMAWQRVERLLPLPAPDGVIAKITRVGFDWEGGGRERTKAAKEDLGKLNSSLNLIGHILQR